VAEGTLLEERKMRKRVVVLLLGVVLAFTSSSTRAAIELNLDRAYNFEWQGVVQHHSPVDIYVANNLDEQRWKDWSIIIGILPGQTPLTSIMVDYDNTSDHSQPIALFEVPLSPTGQVEFLGVTYETYYADTWLAQWEQFGTNPVGSTGPFAIGNPAWVSFHFDVNVDPLVVIKDACIPEPATVSILGLGAVALLRKRSS
jgi:hypothetical protein